MVNHGWQRMIGDARSVDVSGVSLAGVASGINQSSVSLSNLGAMKNPLGSSAGIVRNIQHQLSTRVLDCSVNLLMLN